MNNAPFKRRTYAETYEELKRQHPDASPQGLAFEALGIMADETHAMARLSIAAKDLPVEPRFNNVPCVPSVFSTQPADETTTEIGAI